MFRGVSLRGDVRAGIVFMVVRVSRSLCFIGWGFRFVEGLYFYGIFAFFSGSRSRVVWYRFLYFYRGFRVLCFYLC